jgi:hypothetical protein
MSYHVHNGQMPRPLPRCRSLRVAPHQPAEGAAVRCSSMYSSKRKPSEDVNPKQKRTKDNLEGGESTGSCILKVI